MKFIYLSLSALLISISASSQNLHLNLFAGVSNYNGDLQDKRFTLSQSNLAVGVGAAYDLSDHLALRSSITFASLSANDKYGRNAFRNLNFTSKLTEVNAGVNII